MRASIVDTARKYLDGLAKEAGNDKGLILELAQAYQRLGTVQSSRGASLGQVEQARRSYRQSLDLYARLPVDRAHHRTCAARSRVSCTLSSGWSTMPTAKIWPNRWREECSTFWRAARRILRSACGTRAPSPTSRRSGCGGAILRKRKSCRSLPGQTLLDLQSSGYRDPGLQPDIDNVEQRLAKTKISSGDLDGAASLFQKLLERTATLRSAKPAHARLSKPGCSAELDR